MKKLLLLLLTFSIISFSQYNSNQRDLIKTTFKREFNKNIILKYFSSENHNDVKAALLSISHTADSSFIPEIIKLDYQKYGKYISFALSQMPYNKVSEKYLLEKLNVPEFKNELLISLGKLGGEESFKTIKKRFKEFTNFPGFYLGLVNFHYANRRLNKSEKENLLLPFIKPDVKFLNDMLFSIARIGVTEFDLSNLIPMINQIEDIESKVALIGLIRRSAYIPKKFGELNLINSEDWRIRLELSRYYSKLNFKNINELDNYINLLNDPNNNVSRDCAANLSRIQVDSTFKPHLISVIKGELLKLEEINTVSELFKSLCQIDKKNSFKYLEEFKSKINSSTRLDVLTNIDFNFEKKFSEIKSSNSKLSNSEMLNYTTSLLSLQNKFKNENYLPELFKLFNSNNPPVVFLVSAGLDSLTVLNNSKSILAKCNSVIKNKMNEPQFSEALSSVMELVKKVNKIEYTKSAKILIKSDLISNKNLAEEILGLDTSAFDNDKLFEDIFSASFKYKTAVVKTNKGSFTIKFTPCKAPISVGNFIYLAKKNHFNNIVFHRVVPNFVIQTGDPSGTGWGGPDHTIKSEYNMLNYKRGAVGMASSGKDTEGSQWFVMHSNYPHLDRRYTNFGFVEGEDLKIVDDIMQGDKVIEVIIK